MKCDQATTWLLMSDSPDAPPEPVAFHLKSCAHCRAMQQELIQIEDDVRRLYVPGQSEIAKQRFLAQLDSLPDRNISRTMRRPFLLPRIAIDSRAMALAGGLAVCLLLSFTAGWWLSASRFREGYVAARPDSTGITPPADNGSAEANSQRPHRSKDMELALLGPLIANHLQLAVADDPRELLGLVADLAEILWQEALRQTQEGPTPDLLVVGELYESVVRDGLTRHAQQLNVADREAREDIIAVLRQNQREADKAARTNVPAVAEILKEMGTASSDSAESIAVYDVPEATHVPLLPRNLASSHGLVATLVNESLQVADDNDPLHRADRCANVAEHLSQRIVFTSLNGDAQHSEELGRYLANVVEQGVSVNLDRFEPAGEDDARIAEYDRLNQRRTKSIEVLQNNLERAPPTARNGLTRALEAQQRGRGNGPPHGKDNAPGHSKDFVPPGLRRRNSQEPPSRELPSKNKRKPSSGVPKPDPSTQIEI